MLKERREGKSGRRGRKSWSVTTRRSSVGASVVAYIDKSILTQDLENAPWPEEVAECSAHPDAHRENWAERLPVEEKSAGSRRPRMRLRRRTANCGPHPAEVSDI